MKNRDRIISVMLVVLLCFVMAVPALAASGIEITRQPQSPTYPEGAVATYSVEAAGSNLRYTWFVVFEGVTYDTSKALSGAERQPWEGGSMEGYGTYETGNSFYFQGILPEINGAEIYCVITDGSTSVKSSTAYITVGGSAMPPELVVPSSMTVDVGTAVDLYCAATTYDSSAAEYLWYETSTGKLQDIIAINRGAETDATLHCDTDEAGTRYYVCMVTTSKGGSAYTNVIPVIVREKPAESETDKPSDNTSVPTSAPETDPPSSAPATEAPVSTDVPTSRESDVPDTESTDEEKDGVEWWIIALPIVALFIGGGSALIVERHKKKKSR